MIKRSINFEDYSIVFPMVNKVEEISDELFLFLQDIFRKQFIQGNLQEIIS